ncbi:MAG TPA: hypothetical protein VHZ78_14485 [Rhizomicrobium sp.]|jgi:hypothetical protein|nr:hypothetical protein [Rhizomicrobium sp.]
MSKEISGDANSATAARKPWSTPKVIVSQDVRNSEKVTPTLGDTHVTTPVSTNIAGS